MELQKLKEPMPHKWRIQGFSKFGKPQASCVAYIDARQVMDRLDDVCGPENWQDQYLVIKDNLFCAIGILIENVWTWKQDCGVESNVEKEKGESSDSFKRAAVKWGIGRFLYSMDIIKLPADKIKSSGVWPKALDNNGKNISDITKYCNYLMSKKNDFKLMKYHMSNSELKGVSLSILEQNWVDVIKWHDSINERLLNEGTIWNNPDNS
jgi:hypothetical protein